MKNPTIIQFDTDEHYLTVTDLLLTSWDTKLAGKATDVVSATKLFEEIKTGKLKPDIAIIDAYMGKSEEDGENIAKKLREVLPNIKIISFSTFETKWGDKNPLKGLKDTNNTLVKSLSELIGEEFKFSNVTEKNAPKEGQEYTGSRD